MNTMSRISMASVGIALMLTAAAIGFVEHRKRQAGAQPDEAANIDSFLVVEQPLEAGAIVNQKDIRWRSSKESVVPPGSILQSKHSDAEVVGKRVQRPVVAGEALSFDLLQPTAPGNSLLTILNAGYRAVTIPIEDQDTASGLLRPNDRIDIIALAPVGQNGAVPQINIPLLENNVKMKGVMLLRNVRILAIGGKIDSDESGATLTLELKPADAIRLLEADSEGKIGFVIRQPYDHSDEPHIQAEASQTLQDPASPASTLKDNAKTAESEKVVIRRGRPRNTQANPEEAVLPLSPLSQLP